MPVRLQPGDPAPDFCLPAGDGSQVALGDFAGEKVIVYFYPAALTPGCTTQARDFRDNLASLRAAGYHVVGVSPDQPAKLEQFHEHDHLTFPLLSDPGRTVLGAYGAYGEKTMYGKQVIGVIRSTFVIDVAPDGHGTITLAQYNVKATGHVAKLRRDLGLDDPTDDK